MIHGFPGTPAEMRPLGLSVRDLGWTVHGLRLPGFGADIGTLHERCFSDWTEAVSASVRKLREDHEVVLLIGYSMGGALALHAALDHRVTGLVLLAPFWRLGDRWLDLFWPLVRLVVRRVRPLRHADFSALEVRRSFIRMFGDIDLNSPAVQKNLRALTISVQTLEQLRGLGRNVFRRASAMDTATVVIQGLQDPIVPPHRTKRLINRLGNVVHYYEVEGGHDLVDPKGAAWNQVKTHVIAFAESLGNPQDAGFDRTA
ncbi:MAG TPA: alpha/beta fold hydrolase [Candidatus Binatia bacterium]